MHDFRAKLSDGRVAPAVEAYVDAARRQRREGIGSGGSAFGPVSINLDLTLACDHRCAHCIDAPLLNGGRRLEIDTVRGTLDVLAARGLRSVILIGGGEPTLAPCFEDVVAAIKHRGLECAIVSNGAHNERIAAVAPLLGPKDWVRLSLDAGTDGTFQALHRPRRAVTLERICSSAAEIKRAAPQLELGFSFVVIWNGAGEVANVREMPLAAALAKRHGFDYISFKPVLVRSARRAEVVATREQAAVHEIGESLEAARAHADEAFRVVPSRNLLALLESLSPDRNATQPRQCHMQPFRQVLTPDGIFACPAQRGNPRSRIAGAAGYASAEAFVETVRLAREQRNTFDAAAECGEVTCIYNEANWWLERLIESGRSLRQQAAPDFFL